MSGICGIVNFDGAPVDREVLQALTSFMAFRGPDAQEVWLDGQVGFGHTMLRTTFEAEREHQPLTLDGKVWITADARIDDRATLKGKLGARGCVGLESATDPELILHAYDTWGEACVDHLLGDFTFAIWDGLNQSLFFARDHFGVKPLFYARIGATLIFSNTLDCVRSHPLVSSELNELAIADFLLFEQNQDPSTTVFKDIQRLPSSHTMGFTQEGVRSRCYWTLPTDLEILDLPGKEIIERFKALLEVAVSDRLRTHGVGISMSGGLDSTAIAVVARDLLARNGRPFEVRAQTIVFDRLFVDQERCFAAIAAKHLGLPIDFVSADDFGLFQGRKEGLKQFPEPINESNFSLALNMELSRLRAAHHRVWLTGFDGDSLLSDSPRPWFAKLRAEGHYGRLVTGLIHYAITERKIVPTSFWHRIVSRDSGQVCTSGPTLPQWLAPDLATRLDLPARWADVNGRRQAATVNKLRPFAHRCFERLIRFSDFFDMQDPGGTGVPTEFRHPLLDLRLLTFCLSLPPYPFCFKKNILRKAMVGRLPPAILKRPKTPLAGLPYLEHLKAPDSMWVDQFQPLPELNRFVDRSLIPVCWGASDIYQPWINLRPLSLNLWLRELDRA